MRCAAGWTASLALFFGSGLSAQAPPSKSPSALPVVSAPAPAPTAAAGPKAPLDEYAGGPLAAGAPGAVPPREGFGGRLARRHRALIREIAPDGSRFAIDDEQGGPVDVGVPQDVQRQRLKEEFHAGDMVLLETVSDERDVFLKSIAVARARSSVPSAVVVLLLGALAWWVVFRLVYGRNILGLLVGQDGRYSKSQTQLALWFFTVLVSYTAVLALRAVSSGWQVWGGIDMPQNLLLLSGLSALSFGAAKGITGSRVEQGTLTKTSAEQPSLMRDLFNDDSGRADLGDFQMLVVTGLAVLTYLGSVVGYLARLDLAVHVGLPDVDTTILGAFGIGQGAYLVKKHLEGSPPPGSTPAERMGASILAAVEADLRGEKPPGPSAPG